MAKPKTELENTNESVMNEGAEIEVVETAKPEKATRKRTIKEANNERLKERVSSNCVSTYGNDGIVHIMDNKGVVVKKPISDYGFAKYFDAKLSAPFKDPDTGEVITSQTVKNPLASQLHAMTFVHNGFNLIDGKNVEWHGEKELKYIGMHILHMSISLSPLSQIFYAENDGAMLMRNTLFGHIVKTYSNEMPNTNIKECDAIALALLFYFYRNISALVEYQPNLISTDISRASKKEKEAKTESLRERLFKIKYGNQFFTPSDIVYAPIEGVDFSNDEDCLSIIPNELRKDLGI